MKVLVFAPVWAGFVTASSQFGWLEGVVVGLLVYATVNGIWPRIKWAWLKRWGLKVQVVQGAPITPGENYLQVHVSPRIEGIIDNVNVRCVPTRSVDIDAGQFGPDKVRVRSLSPLNTKSHDFTGSTTQEDGEGGMTCNFQRPVNCRRDSIIPLQFTLGVSTPLDGYLSVMADIRGRARIRGREPVTVNA